MNNCPTTQQIASYLSAESPGDENEALLGHIEECAQCRELMRDISDDIGLGVPLRDYAKECYPSNGSVSSDGIPVSLHVSNPALTLHGDGLPKLMVLAEDACCDDEAGCCEDLTECGPGDECCDAADIKAKCCNKNRYEEISGHAKGGLGEVILARDLELEREVALKRIQPHRADDRNSRLRFIREAIITGKLEHPGIVPVYGRGNDVFGRPYYTMRFVDGASLKDRIANFHDRYGAGSWRTGEARIELQNLIRRLIDVCNTIEYAHNQGVIHRDLKPDNIIVGRFGETIVLDWGLAKHAKDSGIDVRLPVDESGLDADDSDNENSIVPTLFGEAIGTIGYMSPEQSEGKLDEVGPRSDVYSLGAILYRILTGRNSQDTSGDRNDIMKAIRSGEFSRPRDVKRQVPRSLESICLKAMAVSPEDRYQDVREMAKDLDRFTVNERVHAHHESAVEQSFRTIRQNWVVLSLLVTATVTALAVRTVMQSRDLETGRKLQTQQFGQVMQDLQDQHDRLDAEKAKFAMTKKKLQQQREDLDVARAEFRMEKVAWEKEIRTIEE